jgi:tight adherence protein C
MATLQIIIWLCAAALLAAGTLALRRGLHAYAVERSIARRFHYQLVPGMGMGHAAGSLARALEWLGRKAMGVAPVRELQDLLQRGGFGSPAAPFIFAGLRLVATLGVFALALLLPYLRHGAMRPAQAATGFFLGFAAYRGCLIGLKLRITGREREIRRELPYVLDLVLMVLDSGVSIDQALQHVAGQIDRTAPITAVQMRRYLAEVDDGLPYDQALDRLAQRLAISEGRDFSGLLKQNLFQGGELGPPLRRLAADIGDTRLAMAREEMGRKSVLLTLVMLAFFMPVLMVALAGPAVSDIIGTLGNVAHDLRDSRSK